MSSMGSVLGTLGKITRHVIEEKGRNIFLNGSLVPDILNWIKFLPNRTESLNVQNFDIRDFIDWPFDHFDSETVQYGNTFLSVGGSSGTEATQDIIMLNPNNDNILASTWEVLPQKLTNGRRGHVAILLPDDYIDC